MNRAVKNSNMYTRMLQMGGFVIAALALSFVSASNEPKGYPASGNPDTDVSILLGQLGELIARERAYGETIQELVSSARGSSRFSLDESMLDAVLGADFNQRYEEILPKLNELGQDDRRDELALRFDKGLQKKLIAGERVDGINAAAVNNVIAHYKIAIEQLDTSVRQLLLAESLLIRRAADELSSAFDNSGKLTNFVGYVRASHLLAAPGQVKGFVQPRCNVEGDAVKQS